MERPRIYIHLSTLFIVTVIAGAVLGGNLVFRRTGMDTAVYLAGEQVTFDEGRGWPVIFEVTLSSKNRGYKNFERTALLFNITLVFVGILFTAIGLEILRRRK